jgi:TPR repeat protein
MQKRAAELHDEELFKMPPEGDDCPICFLLLPSTEMGKMFSAYCGKIICAGCCREHYEQSNGSIQTCPFCRAEQSANECIRRLEKRADANDADAMYQLGTVFANGDESLSVKKDIDKAVELFHRAAELGCARANHCLGVSHETAIGANRDEEKAKFYYEKGAMAGCVLSRLNLGCIDAKAGRFDRAMKHWLITTSFGDIRSLTYKEGGETTTCNKRSICTSSETIPIIFG